MGAVCTVRKDGVVTEDDKQGQGYNSGKNTLPYFIIMLSSSINGEFCFQQFIFMNYISSG